MTIFLMTGGVVTVATWLYGRGRDQILRNAIISLICAGVIVLLMSDTRERRGFAYNNEEKPLRFVCGYLAGLVLCVCLPLISPDAWPFLPVYVALGLFSTEQIGLFSGALLTGISVLLEESPNLSDFMIYFILGAVALTLLSELTEETHVGPAVFICAALMCVLIVACDILFRNRTLSVMLFVIPAVNVAVSLILLLILLNMFGVYVIRGSNDRYMDINDTEYPLLARLKNGNKEEFFRSIHTAYLAERIALDLGLNARAIKTMAYYHRIGVLDNKNTWEAVEPYFKDHHFPEEAMAYLREYIEAKPGEKRSKEFTVIYLCETLIASIMYLFKNDKDKPLDVEALIDQIFANKMKDPAFHNNDISLYELERMKVLMKKEKLYYDFLR
ncbi:MAG: hypothetical protein IJT34_00675 [Butyrivibrio sp.]|nr:hypothetical protein [Butyrivibrio sp.]